jgi:RecA/RadA recombinase
MANDRKKLKFDRSLSDAEKEFAASKPKDPGHSLSGDSPPILSEDREEILAEEDILTKPMVQLEEKQKLKSVYQNIITTQMNGKPYRNLNEFSSSTNRMHSTGLTSLDGLLYGGLKVGEVVELKGKSGSGKTTLCMYLCSTFASTHQLKTLYIDTTNSFDVNKLTEMLTPRRLSPAVLEQSLTRVSCVKIFDLNALFQLFDELLDQARQNSYQLIVIDSLSVLLSTINGGKKQTLLGNRIADCIPGLLTRIVAVNSCVIVFTMTISETSDQRHTGLGQLEALPRMQPFQNDLIWHWEKYMPHNRIKMEAVNGIVECNIESSVRIPMSNIKAEFVLSGEGLTQYNR